ncbi:MAG: TlpA family protein disulfide reductase [Flavobacteriales bacterium]|nr:TlpA family protein disulfide reductase [Flavobacteriales bacterium]
MNRKWFWTRFYSRNLLFILLSVILYTRFVFQADILLNQIEARDLNNEVIDLSKPTNKPLVINFWATWCAPCIKEFPEYDRIQQRYGDEVDFIMISDETIDKIKQFSISKFYPFRFLKSDKKLSNYDINILPTTFFYNSKGEIIEKHIGSIDYIKLEETIKKIDK